MYDAYYKGNSSHKNSTPLLKLTDTKTPQKKKLKRLKRNHKEELRNSARHLQPLDTSSTIPS